MDVVLSAKTRFDQLKLHRSFGLFGAGWWEGRTHFKPTKYMVRVAFVAGRTGVSDKQFGYFQEIEHRYLDLIGAVGNMLAYAPTPYFGTELFPDLKMDDYWLDLISIPNNMRAPNSWFLIYEFLRLPGQTFSVCLEEWVPLYVEMDD